MTQEGTCCPPEVKNEERDCALKVLSTSQGWIRAEQIALMLWGRSSESLKRKVRRMFETNETVLCGQKGYIKIDRANPEDVSHTVNWLRSQAVKMLLRAKKIENMNGCVT